jgi:DNA-binding transcriptional ArsR family regulator
MTGGHGVDTGGGIWYLTVWISNQLVDYAMSADHLSLIFSALADPTRRAILSRLAGGSVSVTELAAPFAMSLPAVSKHLKVLERAGLIARGREAQWRPCRLDPAPLRAVADWLDAYRQFWDGQLDQLDAYLTEVQQKEQQDADG